MSGTIGDRSEREIVARLIASLPECAADVGPGDDAAVVRLGAERLVLSVDSQRQGVHFHRNWLTAELLGARCISVAASDLAAMGADPLCALMAVGMPEDTSQEWFESLHAGAAARAVQLGCPIVGGDMSTGPEVSIQVSVVGRLPGPRAPLLRSGGRPGDELWVTGRPGYAAAGRYLLSGGVVPGDSRDREEVVDAWRSPQARLDFGCELAQQPLARAAIDVSDGLAIDLLRLCEASRAGAELCPEQLVDDRLRGLSGSGGQALQWVLGGGEDYELLFAAEAAQRRQIEHLGHRTGIPVRRVGVLLEHDDGCWLRIGEQRDPLRASGWQHFGVR